MKPTTFYVLGGRFMDGDTSILLVILHAYRWANLNIFYHKFASFDSVQGSIDLTNIAKNKILLFVFREAQTKVASYHNLLDQIISVHRSSSE